MDIGVANGANTLLVLLGTGTGQLAGSHLHRTKGLPTDLVNGDLNNDGLADVVAVNTTSNSRPAPPGSVSVFFSKGNGSF